MTRLRDNDLLAAGADPQQASLTAMALLAALNFVLALGLLVREVHFGTVFAQARAATLLSDAGWLVSLTLLVTILVTTLSWDALYPDRRDATTLGVLPVPRGLVLRARLFAIGFHIAGFVAATNLVTALVLPVLCNLDGGLLAVLRSSASWLLAIAAAAATVLFLQIALQGVLLALLPYAVYQRLSATLQLLAVMGAFLGFFLAPAAELARSTPLEQGLWNPSWWFVGLYGWLRGDLGGLPSAYGVTGALAVPVSGAAALAIYTALHHRLLYRVCEQSENLPSRAGRLARGLRAVLDRTLLRRPAERAIFYFLVRTASRNRRHRMVLAVTTAVGFAWAGSSLAQLARHGWSEVARPSVLVLGVPIELAVLLVVGLKASFQVPVDLPANWALRLARHGSAGEVERAAGYFLYLAGVVPVALLPLGLLLFAWGPSTALLHTAYLLLGGATLVDCAVRGLNRMPFAAAIEPGRGNLRVKFGIWLLTFLFTCYWLAVLEEAALRSPRGRLNGLVILSMACLWRLALRWRRGQPAKLEFEEPLHQDLDLLRLHG